ncbi:zinc finger protein 43-like [Coccinella septempunctata]|uniref:zinc finger protein 43-like n=1 Tax=Coccinella septempunctata TaxID=41139 RepID=UPI001D079C73|nr:zinc finger protein 43-like [Coccinella septempunctata]
MSIQNCMPVNKKCRLCLQKTEASINLFEGNFQQMILELTSLKITEDDIFPKIACIICIDEIQQAFKTRNRILECHKKLEQLYTNTINEPGQNSHDGSIHNSKESRSKTDELKEDKCLKDNSIYEDYSDLVIKSELTEDNENITYEEYDPSKIQNNIPTEEIDSKLKNRSCDLYNDLSLFDPLKVACINKRRQDQLLGRDQIPKHYICDECGEVFPYDLYTIRLHRSKHKKSKCEICGIVTRTDNMKKHIDGHNSGPRVCESCGKTCKNIESLRSHIYYMHTTSADKFKCDQCSKSYRKKYKLESHKNKEHTGSRRYTCNICQKKFFSNWDLKKHVSMTHEKLRPYICQYCNKGFSSLHALKTHTRQHTNETPFKCSICAEGFRQNVSLRSHLKSKHNIEENKNFPCEFCDKSFGSNFALKVHLRLHSEQCYKCDECEEYFNQSIYLFNHMKTVHNMEESMVDIKKFKINVSNEANEDDKKD